MAGFGSGVTQSAHMCIIQLSRTRLDRREFNVTNRYCQECYKHMPGYGN